MSGLVSQILEKNLAPDKWRGSGYRSRNLSRFSLGSWAGGGEKEMPLVKVSIYTNMKRHGGRKMGSWRLSCCPIKLDICLLLVPLGLMCKGARVGHSHHVVLKSVFVE